MGTPLASTDDVALLYTPLVSADQPTLDQVTGLIRKASAILRQRIPWVDDRIARFAANPADLGGLDPDLVADVVATMVKRFLVNQTGVSSETESETVGPYSKTSTNSYLAPRVTHDTSVRGELQVTPNDIDKLRGAVKMSPKIGTGRVGSTLAHRGRPDIGAWPPNAGDYVPEQGWINPPDGTP